MHSLADLLTFSLCFVLLPGPPKMCDEKSLENLLNMVAFSQPDPVLIQTCKDAAKYTDDAMGCFFSFSQPAEGKVEDYFLTSSSSTSAVMSSQNTNLANQWVKRMTRFFVTTDKHKTVERISEFLERNGLKWKISDCLLAKYSVVRIY